MPSYSTTIRRWTQRYKSLNSDRDDILFRTFKVVLGVLGEFGSNNICKNGKIKKINTR